MWQARSMSSDQVYFLYGTESGNSEKVASIGCKSAIALGYDAELVDMGQLDMESLHDWHNLFMVIGTNGEGEMPLNAESAWEEDRKSTRLNSSHVRISYAVFCLKKK